MGFLGNISNMVQKAFVDEPIDVHTMVARHRAAELSEFLPYRLYDDELGLYVNEDGYGFVLEIVPLMGVTQQSFDVLKGAFSLAVPDEVSVQIMQLCSPKTGAALKRWGAARAGASGPYRSIVKNRLQHLGRASYSSLSSSSNFMMRYHRIFVSVSCEGFDDLEIPIRMQEYRESLLASLRQASGYAVEVKPEALIRVVEDILNPTLSIQPSRASYDETESIHKQVVREDTSFFVYRDRIETTSVRGADPMLGEDRYVDNAEEDHMEMRCLEVRQFPRQVLFGSMASLLGDFFTPEVRFSSPSMSVLNIYYPKAEAAKVTAEGKQMRARQVAEGPGGRFMVSMRNRAEDWDRAQQAIVDGGRPVQVSMFNVTTAPVGHGRAAERNARNVFQSARFEMRRSDMVHLPTLIAALPMCGEAKIGRDVRAMNRSRTQISNMVAPSAPVFGEFLGTAEPNMLLVGRLGQPMFYSNFSSKGGGNFNGVCAAPSGSGKSFFFNEMVMCHTSIGGHAIVIDDGFSFMNACKLLGGQHYTFSISSEFCLNPFDMIDPAMCDETREGYDPDYLGERLETCRAIYAQMTLGDTPPTTEQSGILMDVVTKVWNSKGTDGQTDDVQALLESYETVSPTANPAAMANSMKPYCTGGPYGSVFNGKNTLDLSNPYTVFELSPLEQKKELRSIIVTALFALIDSKVTTDRLREDLIVLDEAWKLLQSETVAATLEGWARRLRKYGAGLLVATQSIADFTFNDKAKAVLSNSEWTLVLKTKGSDIGALHELGVLPDSYAERIVKDLKTSRGEYSECLIMCQDWYAVGRLVVDKFTAALYSTSADQVAEVNRLQREQGLDLEEALAVVASSGRFV